MMLTGVYDELSRHSEGPQRLIHLFAAGDGDIEVLFPAHEQRRRGNAVRMKEGIRHLEPQRRVAPRRAELIVVLDYVFIAPIRRQLIAAARSADRDLEAPVGGNGVIG